MPSARAAVSVSLSMTQYTGVEELQKTAQRVPEVAGWRQSSRCLRRERSAAGISRAGTRTCLDAGAL